MTDMDRAIEEIREARRRLSEECGHDIPRFIERLKAFNDRYREQVAAYRKSHPVRHAATPPGD